MSEVRVGRQKYGGYDAPLAAREDTDLTHVGRGTPGGEYLRRFWQPIALTSELGAVPVPLRVLGHSSRRQADPWAEYLELKQRVPASLTRSLTD